MTEGLASVSGPLYRYGFSVLRLQADQQRSDQLIRGHVVCIRLVIQKDSVAQCGQCGLVDVLFRNIKASSHQSHCFGGQDDCLHSAWTGTVAYIAIRLWCGVLGAGMGHYD